MKKYKVILYSGETLFATNDLEKAIDVAERLNLKLVINDDKDT